jgi:hypothetical protein
MILDARDIVCRVLASLDLKRTGNREFTSSLNVEERPAQTAARQYFFPSICDSVALNKLEPYPDSLEEVPFQGKPEFWALPHMGAWLTPDRHNTYTNSSETH